MAQKPSPARPPRRALVTVLVIAATLVGFLAITAVWVDRQLLNTDNWAESSSELLESDAIRGQVAAFLTDEAYAAYDVEARISAGLPPRAAPLAGPAAGALRSAAQQGIDRLLQRPRVQERWETANRRAHSRLLQVVEGGGDAVSTEGGEVTLDLKEVLEQTSEGVGVGGRAADKIPEDAAEITILRSGELGTAQDVMNILRKLPIVLTVLCLGLFALAVALAGRRREALRSVGIGFLVIGIGALLVQSAGGNALVDALAKTEATRPVVEDAWEIGTTQLVIAAEAMIGYGVVLLLAAWLAGPTRIATSFRRWAAPYLIDARYAFGTAAVLAVLVVLWDPTPATRNPIALLVFAALLALGIEALRRQVAREFPEIDADNAAAHRADYWRRGRSTLANRGGAPDRETTADVAQQARLEQLEQLGRLRDSGVLASDEYEREKRQLVGTSVVGDPPSD